MSIFSTVLFLHIVGALGVSVALGVEWIGLSQIRKATMPGEIHALLKIVQSTTRFGFASMLSTVITGIYMVLAAVGWVPWLLVVIGALVLLIVLTRVLTAPRMAAIGQAFAMDKGSVSQTFQSLINDPMLWISVHTRAAIVLGIILLKIATPGLGGSLFTIGVAVVLGVASAWPMRRPMQVRQGSADRSA
jgi:hypothetical protein